MDTGTSRLSRDVGFTWMAKAEAAEAPRLTEDRKIEVNGRLANLAHAVLNTAAGVADGVVGAIETPFGVVSREMQARAYQNLAALGRIPASVFVKALRVLNPSAEVAMFPSNMETPEQLAGYGLDNSYREPEFQDVAISAIGDGLLSDPVGKVMGGLRARVSLGGIFSRQVAGRLLAVLRLATMAVTRTVDLGIGLGAAALSVVTLGTFTSLNDVAYRGLCGTKIVADAAFAATDFIGGVEYWRPTFYEI